MNHSDPNTPFPSSSNPNFTFYMVRWKNITLAYISIVVPVNVSHGIGEYILVEPRTMSKSSDPGTRIFFNFITNKSKLKYLKS